MKKSKEHFALARFRRSSSVGPRAPCSSRISYSGEPVPVSLTSNEFYAQWVAEHPTATTVLSAMSLTQHSGLTHFRPSGILLGRRSFGR